VVVVVVVVVVAVVALFSYIYICYIHGYAYFRETKCVYVIRIVTIKLETYNFSKEHILNKKTILHTD
jgi:hypothetical protein